MATWKRQHPGGRASRLVWLFLVLVGAGVLMLGLVFSGAMYSATSGSSLGLLLTIGMLMAGGGCLVASLVVLYLAARTRGAHATGQLDIVSVASSPSAKPEEPRQAA